jgi:hypothetical protein
MSVRRDYVERVDMPFGTRWVQLSLASLRRFFAGTPRESRAWDAKRNPAELDARGVKREDALKEIVRTAGSTFANERGGFLVLGAAEAADGRWDLGGVDLPKRVREPHDWISSVVRRLDLPPPFDVKHFPLGDRVVIVMRFDEAVINPCMTLSGASYRRAGGSRSPLTTPT